MYVDSEKYINKTSEEELSTLLGKLDYKINSYGKWTSKKDTKLKYTSSDFEILYYSKGGSTISANGRKYECKPGSMFIVEPFSLVSIENKGYKSYECYSMHFEIKPAYLQVQFKDILLSDNPIISKEEYLDLEAMFEKLYLEKINEDIGYIAILTSALLRIIVEVIRVQQKRNPVPIRHVKYDNQQVKVVNNALHYISKNKDKAIKISELSKELGVSNSYLYKSFVKIMGISPSKYILQFKIKKAKELLSLQTHTIEEIGFMLGFSSPYHFSNTFKSIESISPKEYELNIRNHKNYW